MEISEKTKEQLLEEIEKLKDRINKQVVFPGFSVINKYEQSFRQKEERYEKFSEAATEAIVLHNNGIILDANDEAYRLLGYKREEAIGKSVLDFAAEESKDLIKNNLSKGISRSYEAVALKKDGKKFPCSLSAKDILFGNEVIRAVTIRDISELKEKELALRESENYYKESEEKYRLLFENNLAGVFRSTVDGTFIKTNTAFAKIFGYETSEDMKKISSKDLYFSEKDRQTYIKALQKNKFLSNYTLKLKDRTGETVWVLANVTLLKNISAGDYIEGTLIDITEQKNYEQRLEKSRESYRNLIEDSPDAIIIHDEKGEVLFGNKTAIDMFGVSSIEEFKKTNLILFAPAEFRDEIRERKKKVFEGGQVPFIEYKLKRADGTLIEVESKPTLIDFFGNKAILVVYHNLPAQRLLEREQVRAQVAEEANKKLQLEIKERKKAERRLLQSQKYARSIIESSLDMIVATNQSGEITEFNHAAQRNFGYKSEEVLSKHVSILFAEIDKRVNIMTDLMEGPGAFSGEVINVKKNGEKFTSYLSASVLRNVNGEVIGAMGVSRDITEEIKAEKELKEKESRYRAIFNQAYVGIAQIGKDGRFLNVNEQLCKIMGYTEEELLSKKFVDITAPADLEKSIKFKAMLLAGEIDNFTTEKQYVHKSGSLVAVSLTASLVRDAAGKPDYFIAVFHDITEKRKITEQISLQAAKLNAIIESSSHLIWTVSRDYKLLSFNQNCADSIKATYRITPYVGMSVAEGEMISTDMTNEIWMRKTEEAFKGRPQHFESKITDRHGNVRWLEIYFNPIFGPKAEINEVSGIGHDITEKKEAEEKIRQSLKEKEVLLKEVHHRVKNNLQVISSILNLQSSYVKDKNTLQLLKESQNRIKSMAYIHESLYQTKDFASINFSEYVVNISKSLLHSYVGNKGHITLDFDLQEVFLNLDLAIPCGLIINEIISNSLKYAFKGRERGRIGVILEKNEDGIRMEISDNGIGMPPEIDYRNTESLGLQLVITLVDQLSAEIKMENQGGTKYIITFNENQLKK